MIYSDLDLSISSTRSEARAIAHQGAACRSARRQAAENWQSPSRVTRSETVPRLRLLFFQKGLEEKLLYRREAELGCHLASIETVVFSMVNIQTA
jgi:hypothetical protein